MIDTNSPETLERALEETTSLRERLAVSENRRKVAEALAEERRIRIEVQLEMIESLQAALIKRLDAMDAVALKAMEAAGPEQQPPMTQRFQAIAIPKRAAISRHQQEMNEVLGIINHFKKKHPDPVTTTDQAIDEFKDKVEKSVQ